ncbi:MAG: ClpX C4-type zinc finger protein, partial [Bacteroidota bacterium]
MIKKGNPPQNHCSFCGRGEEDAMILISGIEGRICEVCADKAQEIIDQELRKAGVEPPQSKKTAKKEGPYSGPLKLLTPKDIKKILD